MRASLSHEQPGQGWRCHDGRVVRVVVVEDDDRIRTLLRLALEDEGYWAVEAESGERGVDLMRADPAELMIVDLMLGGIDGFSCIRQVRRFSDAPVIIVSARADTHDIVAGLEAGADDYVTKPFQVKEITARLRALRRRTERREPEAEQFVLDPDPDAQLVLLPGQGVLRRGQDQVHLTLTEFRVLTELVEAGGRSSAARSCCSGCGTTGSTATSGWSTCTSVVCGPRSSVIRAIRGSWSPSAGSVTGQTCPESPVVLRQQPAAAPGGHLRAGWPAAVRDLRRRGVLGHA